MNKQNLTQEQQDILVGTLLGDSKLVFSNFTNAAFACEQGLLHKNYLFSLFSVFKDLCTITDPVERVFFDKRYGKNYISYYFYTATLPIFSPYALLFYVINDLGKKVKVVPSNILELLTPRALAY